MYHKVNCLRQGPVLLGRARATDIGVNGVPATQKPIVQSGVSYMRDAVMDQGVYYGTPKWVTDPATGKKVFIGAAYEPDPVSAADHSRG